MGMYVYVAYDEYGLFLAEAYRKSDLICKLEEEFKYNDNVDMNKIKIKRIYDKNRK